MTTAMVMGAWVVGSFLFGLLAGQLFRFLAERGRLEEESVSLFQKKLSSATHPADEKPYAKLKIA